MRDEAQERECEQKKFVPCTLLCSITFEVCFAARENTYLLFPFVNNIQMHARICFLAYRLRARAAFPHADVVTFILAHLHVACVA